MSFSPDATYVGMTTGASSEGGVLACSSHKPRGELELTGGCKRCRWEGGVHVTGACHVTGMATPGCGPEQAAFQLLVHSGWQQLETPTEA